MAPIFPVAQRSCAARMAGTVIGTMVLAFFFANVEIQIEGGAGWATGLPTWRIEQHWLLDLFWGGRAMTGYHAWVFSFMFLFFHFPMVAAADYSSKAESRALACIMLFWIIEDFLWFILNPAFGLAGFNPVAATWHKHWLWHAPIEYWVFLPVSAALFRQGFRTRLTATALLTSRRKMPITAPRPSTRH